jgi:HEAT repeat protein
MRKHNKTNSLVVLFAAVLSVVFSAVGSFAQNVSIKELTPNKYALENLLNGIESDNEGVKRSAIYFTGKYKIAEAEDALIAQLKKEQNPSTRILIALVLLEMGSDEGLMYVKKLSMEDADAKVRRMATHIYNDYLMNDGSSTAFNSR